MTAKYRFLLAGLGLIVFIGCSTSRTVDGEVKKVTTPHDRAMVYLQAANAAIMDGDLPAAFQLLKNAEDIDDSLPEIYHSRAIALGLKKETQAAIASVRKALEIKPTFSKAANTLGKFLLDVGKTDEAEKYLIQAANDDTNNEAFKADTNLGMLYYRKNEFKKAEKHLSKAIAGSKYGACVAYYYRGHIELKDGNFQKAIDDYEHASKKICAGFGEAHLALGIAFARDKQYDKARRTFLSIDQTFPKSKVAEQALNRLKDIP